MPASASETAASVGVSARYEERPVAHCLEGIVACTWFGQVASSGEGYADRVLPDGCMDLVWGGGQLTIAGPDTSFVPLRPQAGSAVAGLRFRPGMAPRLLGVPASALLDQRVPAREVMGDRGAALEARLAGTASATAMTTVLESAVAGFLGDMRPRDRAIEQVVAGVRSGQFRSVATLADDIGLGERQLHRRCVAAVGYGPQMLLRVLRMQRFLALADGRAPRQLANLAATCGYADQAHLTRDCVVLGGLPPSRLIGRPITSQ